MTGSQEVRGSIPLSSTNSNTSASTMSAVENGATPPRAPAFSERTLEEFLASHWQQRPLLVRQAFPGFHAPVTREQLVHAACRPDVSSRRITMPHGEAGWALHNGPFQPADLDDDGEVAWSLLVQEANRLFPEVAELLERFRFVPNWRVDDVMVSYAPDGGGIGPHIDRHDVFLLQASGRRRWRIGDAPLREERRQEGAGIPVLETFSPTHDWILDPGDMLYLPPRIAHEGTAVGESITCSIGFRTPDPRQLIAGFPPRLPPAVFDRLRYTDPGLVSRVAVGEIPGAARRQLRERCADLFRHETLFDRWVGCQVTRPRRELPAGEPMSGSELLEFLRAGGRLMRSAPSHFAWYADPGQPVWLFVGGEEYPLDEGDSELAERLCGRRRLDAGTLDGPAQSEAGQLLLRDLIGRGFLLKVP